MAKKPEKTAILDSDWQMLIIDGQEKRGLTRANAALFLGKTVSGLDTILKRYPDVQKWQIGVSKERYLLEEDLKKMKQDLYTAHPAE